MARDQGPLSITSEWIQDFLHTKYVNSKFGLPQPFQVQVTSDMFASGVAGIDPFLFGSSGSRDTLLIGMLDISFISVSDQYGFDIYLRDANYKAGSYENSVLIYDQYLNPVITPDFNKKITKQFHFDCIDVAQVNIGVSDTASTIALVFNGYKVTRTS